MLGLNFDYNNIDLSWDQTPGDLDRLEKIIDLVDFISGMDIQNIFNNTIDSVNHNKECIVSGQFANNCNLVNQKTEKSILDKFVC
jgi:hypothetical protein